MVSRSYLPKPVALLVDYVADNIDRSPDHAQQLKVYHVDVVTVAVSTLLCALVFVCYGCRLRGRLSSIPDPPPLVKAATSKILLATAWSGLCFSIRCTLFLWSATIRTGEPTPCFINATVDKIACECASRSSCHCLLRQGVV